MFESIFEVRSTSIKPDLFPPLLLFFASVIKAQKDTVLAEARKDAALAEAQKDAVLAGAQVRVCPGLFNSFISFDNFILHSLISPSQKVLVLYSNVFILDLGLSGEI